MTLDKSVAISDAQPFCAGTVRGVNGLLSKLKIHVSKKVLRKSLVGFCLMLLSSFGIFAQEQKSQVVEAQQLNTRALELYQAGRYDEAMEVAEGALAIFEKELGAEDARVGMALSNLALLHSIRGDYARAESYGLRALSIVEKTSGAESAAVATLLNNLGDLYREWGDYTRAEPLMQRAAKIDEAVLGREHPGYAIDLMNLGKLYMAKGDASRAEEFYQRGLAIFEKAHGTMHVDVATALNQLSNLHQELGEYAKAEPLLRRALAIYEKELGAEHPYVGTLLANMASLLTQKGEYAEAVRLNQRSLAITEKAVGAEHANVGSALNNLGLLYQRAGDFARAEAAYRRALVIWEKTLGAEHPDVSGLMGNLSSLHEAQGDFARAVEFQARAGEITERNLARHLSAGSETEKQILLKSFRGETSATVALHVRHAPANEQAARLALTTILRRKGRALDAMTDQIGALRQRANEMDRALLDDLVFGRSQLSTLKLAHAGDMLPDERRSAIILAEREIEELEDLISRRSAEFRGASQPVTLDAVRAAIPPDAALVEIFAYLPTNIRAKNQAGRFGAEHYVAYVVKRETTVPQWVELGEAATIDEAASRWRAALGNPPLPRAGERISPEEFERRMNAHESELKTLARTLDERVMLPVRKLLGQTRRVFVSPDGALNLVPFAALVDEQGKYLIENYSISYLTSGRDLLRLQVQAGGAGAPVVLANPLFDSAERSKVSAGSKPLRGITLDAAKSKDVKYQQIDFASAYYPPLVGTADEARSINALLPQSIMLTGTQATEGALKQVARPRILHIATHGFFLPDQSASGTKLDSRGTDLETSGGATTPVKVVAWENPLLRSGLILAGVNQRASGANEDGVLTALEASGLDLWGTKLVVLSACETGLGDVRNGDGVYGLRRALLLAGSETQLMSLWQVSDAATRDIMVAYYKLLRAGASRTEALRQVQLDALRGGGGGGDDGAAGQQSGLALEARRPASSDAYTATVRTRYGHPFFWAAFVPSGAWTSLDGK